MNSRTILNTATKATPSHPPNKWVLSLYFAQGLPFFLITMMSSVIYKSLGINNTCIIIVSSCFFIPWTIKPALSVFIERFSSVRHWTIAMELSIGFALLIMAITLSLTHFFLYSLTLFVLLSFMAASHDICSDGYYLMALNTEDRHRTLGHRNAAYQFSQLLCHGGLIALAGWFMLSMPVKTAWQITLVLAAITMISVALWHQYSLALLPTSSAYQKKQSTVKATLNNLRSEWKNIDHPLSLLVFIFLFNASYAQLSRIIPLFFMDSTLNHGLALTTFQVSQTLTIGVVAFIIGSFLLSFSLRQVAIKDLLIIGALFMILASISYTLLMINSFHSITLIIIIHAIAQCLFGFSNSAYMATLMHHTKGKRYTTSLFALFTSIMCLSFLFFGLTESWLQSYFSYGFLFILSAALSVGILLMTSYIAHNKRSLVES